MTLGLIAIAVMLFAPKGLWGLISARTTTCICFRSAAGWWGPKIEVLEIMANIEADVMIVEYRTGRLDPRDGAARPLRVANMVVNRYRWLSRARGPLSTNQRTMEVLRDLGPEVEAEAMMHASPQELMGENIFMSLAGEEISPDEELGQPSAFPKGRASPVITLFHERSAPDFHGAN